MSLAWLTLLAAPGCSGDGASGASGGAGGGLVNDAGAGSGSGSGSGGGSGSDARVCGAEQHCTAPGHELPVDAQLVTSLFARVVDLEGNPATLQATVCGTNVCIFGETDDAGVVVTCDESEICLPGIRPGLELLKPAFKYGTGFEYAEFAYLLPAGQTSYDLGEVTAVALPPLGTGAPLACGTEASSGGLTLRLDANTKVEIEVITYKTPEERALRAVSIPVDRAPMAVDHTLGFEILLATTPVNTVFCPPAALSVDNTAGWAAGTPVEIFVHGVDATQQWAPFGGWTKVSDGVVSSDGTKVETTPEGGLPVLSVIGIRKRP